MSNPIPLIQPNKRPSRLSSKHFSFKIIKHQLGQLITHREETVLIKWKH